MHCLQNMQLVNIEWRSACSFLKLDINLKLQVPLPYVFTCQFDTSWILKFDISPRVYVSVWYFFPGSLVEKYEVQITEEVKAHSNSEQAPFHSETSSEYPSRAVVGTELHFAWYILTPSGYLSHGMSAEPTAAPMPSLNFDVISVHAIFVCNSLHIPEVLLVPWSLSCQLFWLLLIILWFVHHIMWRNYRHIREAFE